MKYTADELKPKRYPDEKPSFTGKVLLQSIDGRWGWYYAIKDKRMLMYGHPVAEQINRWFIDIPGAPEELKPLAYPVNKPDNGWYMVHSKDTDKWGRTNYCRDTIRFWDGYIDQFIPYRLDEPVSDTDELEPLGNSEQLEREDEVGVIWETDFIYAITRRDSKYAQIQIIKSNGMIPKVELTAFAQHWLNQQGEGNKYMDALKWIRTWTCNDGRGYKDAFRLLEKIDDYVNKVLDDDTHKETELLPCPVCGWPNINAYSEPGEPEWYFVICHNCNIRTDGYLSEKIAIEAWNALPRKTERGEK